MLPIPDQTVQESEEDKVSAMEARLNAACFDLSGHEPEQGPSVWDPDSESNAEGDSAFPSDNDEGWTSPEDSPLPTPLHSPLVDARPLKSAIRNGDSASSSETSSITSHDGQNKDRKGSFVSFQDEPQILSTWAPTDYAR